MMFFILYYPFSFTWANLQTKGRRNGWCTCFYIIILARLTQEQLLPGWLWKRLRTLFSGVLKKAVAIELYSPSAQNNLREAKREEKMIRVAHQQKEDEPQRPFLPVFVSLLKLLHAIYQLTYNSKRKGIKTDGELPHSCIIPISNLSNKR